MKVEVLDRMMGAGKTNAILQWLKPEMRFIFVTPLLSEAEERINAVRPDLAVKCPERLVFKDGDKWRSSKAEDMLLLLSGRENIATTHALLKTCDERHWKLIQQLGYTIVLDEEVSLIEAFRDVPPRDMLWLFDNGHLSRDDTNGRLTFHDASTVQKVMYTEVKEMCGKGLLYSSKRYNGFVVSCLPVDVLMCARRVIIMSYMFKGSLLEQFLSLHGVEWIEFTGVDVPDVLPSSVAHLIEPVSKSYYKPYDKLSLTQTSWKNMKSPDIQAVERTLSNIFRPYDAADCGFSLPKEFVIRRGELKNRLIKPNGKVHKEGRETWIYPKCRATNEYAHKKVMVYALDVHPNSAVDAYLTDMGVSVDRDHYALSQLVQWLWRGCIRKGEPMTVAILAPRMRKLFERWLNDEFVVSNPLSYRMASENLGIVFVDSPVADVPVKEPSADKNMPTTCWDGWEQDDGTIEAPCVFDKQLPSEYVSECVDNEMPVISWEGFF